MFKKLTAGIVAISILSVSSMALAGTPKRNHQADFPASKPVWAKPHFNAAHRGKAAGAPLQQPRIPKAANGLKCCRKEPKTEIPLPQTKSGLKLPNTKLLRC